MSWIRLLQGLRPAGSDQTRIADALEDMVALSLPDDTTNTTEE